MNGFEIDQAIGAGFRVIRHGPAAFLAWGVIYFVLGFLPQVWMMSIILPEFTRLSQMTAAGTTVMPPQIFRTQMLMLQVEPVVWLGYLLTASLILGAVYRAVLFPEERRAFYVRIGKQELWLGLTLLVLMILLGMGMAAGIIPVVIVGGLVAAAAHNSALVAFIPILFLFVFAAVIWLGLRLSMATPASFAEGRFRLYESWAMTRGHAGKLFLTALAILVICWVAELIIVGITLVAIGGPSALAGMPTWFQHPEFGKMAPFVLATGVLASLWGAAMYTLFGAAWATIYRELSAGVEHPVGVAR
jgi:hypothetical protein